MFTLGIISTLCGIATLTIIHARLPAEGPTSPPVTVAAILGSLALGLPAISVFFSLLTPQTTLGFALFVSCSSIAMACPLLVLEELATPESTDPTTTIPAP